MATIEGFLNTKPADLEQSIRDLRLHILNEGIPSGADNTLRCIIWSILLRVAPMETDAYLELVYRGPSSAYQKIRNDTFRTLASDPMFKNRVSELSLIRVLNSHAWTETDKLDASSQNSDQQEPPYVQGMNILAAPFLYASNSEVEAFALFSTWVTRDIPLYVRSSLQGVHLGVKLVDKCLEKLDSKLFAFLQSKGLNAELYAFPCKHEQLMTKPS